MTKRMVLAAAVLILVFACGRRTERAWFDAPSPEKPMIGGVGPLPESAFRVRWSPVAFPREIDAGRWTAVEVTFTNAGDVVWPDRQTADPLASGAWAVRLAYAWTPGARSVHRSDLEKPLAPGESATRPIAVRAPDTPGDYVLRFELLQEGNQWFAARGADVLEIPVRVRAKSPASATASPIAVSASPLRNPRAR